MDTTIEADEVVTKEVDEWGRISLGTEYSGKKIKIAFEVLE